MNIQKRAVSIGAVIGFLILAATLPMPGISLAAGFTPLGFLEENDNISLALGVSPDGAMVLGTSRKAYSNYSSDAFQWTQEKGMVKLEYGVNNYYTGAAAYAASADGSRVVGRVSRNSRSAAFLWTQAAGIISLGDLRWGRYHSHAYDISADGTTVVGFGNSAEGTEAIIWTEEHLMVGLGDLAGGHYDSRAHAISADGSIVAGYGSSAEGREAIVWTQGTGMVGLGDLDGGNYNSQASDISADGSVVVGSGSSADGIEAFIWTEEAGMVGLGSLGDITSAAHAVSGDGSVVVGGLSGGDWQSGYEYHAFLWTEDLGMVYLYDFLLERGVAGLEGWTLKSARAISDDGLTIVGDGINPDGDKEGWVVSLDEGSFSAVPVPGTVLLLASGLVGLAGFSRRSYKNRTLAL